MPPLTCWDGGLSPWIRVIIFPFFLPFSQKKTKKNIGISALAMFLTFSFSQKYYDMLCGKCHLRCFDFCVRRVFICFDWNCCACDICECECKKDDEKEAADAIELQIASNNKEQGATDTEKE